MSGEVIDRRTARRAATRQQIVDAAWALAREEGLSGITMRDLGSRVGMTAQSLYAYFASKHDIYDAMFEQGYVAFAEWMAAVDDPGLKASRSAKRAGAVESARRFVEFCVVDPVRFHLLFQRTLPGFEPSAASYVIAVEVLQVMRERTRALGVERDDSFDLWTATMTGLASQQIANDPGGDRWTRLVEGAVDMLLAQTAAARTTRRA